MLRSAIGKQYIVYFYKILNNSNNRKNPLHKQEFCHPGDDDYESDPNDVRPICIYDSNCYRKNKDHRNAYKHSRDAPKRL